MIIYGSKAVHLKSAKSTRTCPNCNNQGTLTFDVFGKHAHIFWIPLFPLGKKGYSECSHCKQVLEIKEMPEPIKQECRNFKSETKSPIWQFAGLGIFLAVMAIGAYASENDKKLEKEYIVSPQKGDVYEYKVETGNYSTMKVVKVSKDSVFVSPNEYEISRRSKIYKIDKPKNYSQSSFGISRDKIKKMYDTGEIFDINR